MKNPNVDTSFLPDKQRDEALQREKLLQKHLWLERQERIKNEIVRVDFNFFDGTTHPSSFTLKKKESVREVLCYAIRTFQELKKLSADKIIMVKDNHIVPSYLTFYELIETYGADGKTTLAHWDLESTAKNHFHVVLTTTLAKIMERKLYEKNAHIYPYTLWEEFDEFKQRDFQEELKKAKKEKDDQRHKDFIANMQ